MNPKTHSALVVSKDLRDALKARAAQQGRKLQELIEEVLKQWLAKK